MKDKLDLNDKTTLSKVVFSIKDELETFKTGDLDLMIKSYPAFNNLVGYHVDKIEKEIKQNRRSASTHKNQIVKAFGETSRLKENIEDIHTHCNNLFKEFTENTKNTQITKAEVEKNKNSSELILNELIDIQKTVKDFKKEFDSVSKQILKTKKEIDDFNNIREKSISNFNTIKDLFNKTENMHQEIKKFHTDIFGDLVYGETTSGLKLELESSFKDLKNEISDISENMIEFKSNKETEYLNHEKKWEEQFNILIEKIKGLLPTAMTAGLSFAYQEKKKSETEERNSYRKVFDRAIIAMTVISLIPFFIYMYLYFGEQREIIDLISTIPKVTFSLLPLYFPALWVAYSADKKSKLSKRLIEEYSHKEALSKTYEGLSSQVKKYQPQSEDDNLSYELLRNLVSVSSENPGKLISDYNNSDHPIYDAVVKNTLLNKLKPELNKNKEKPK